MPITRIVTHLSPKDRSNQAISRLLKVSLCLMVFLWGGGILAFVVLHILQARTSQHFTIPDLLEILLLSPLIGILFFLGCLATASMGREVRLKVFGRKVIGEMVPETERSIYHGDGEYEYFRDVEFQTPNGVRHRVVIKGMWIPHPMRLRYDPFDPSNVEVIFSPQPKRHPVLALLAGMTSWGCFCGCLLVSIGILGSSLVFLAVFLLAFFIPTAPSHP